jgi:hypothetical protein
LQAGMESLFVRHIWAEQQIPRSANQMIAAKSSWRRSEG